MQLYENANNVVLYNNSQTKNSIVDDIQNSAKNINSNEQMHLLANMDIKKFLVDENKPANNFGNEAFE